MKEDANKTESGVSDADIVQRLERPQVEVETNDNENNVGNDGDDDKDNVNDDDAQNAVDVNDGGTEGNDIEDCPSESDIESMNEEDLEQAIQDTNVDAE